VVSFLWIALSTHASSRTADSEGQNAQPFASGGEDGVGDGRPNRSATEAQAPVGASDEWTTWTSTFGISSMRSTIPKTLFFLIYAIFAGTARNFNNLCALSCAAWQQISGGVIRRVSKPANAARPEREGSRRRRRPIPGVESSPPCGRRPCSVRARAAHRSTR
jgi:hypothetical protein